MSMLFQEGKIGELLLKNRFVRSATEEYMAEDDGSIDEEYCGFFERLAAGGCGMIILGHAFVSLNGRCHPWQKGAHDDRMIESFARIKESVKKTDRRIIIIGQINHGGRQTDPSITEPVAPSPVRPRGMKIVPRELTSADIRDIIKEFAEAALRMKKAGLDGVQIHSAHGYLLSQFMSPYTNRRTDEWGGNMAGRLKLPREVVRAVRESVGDSYPVLIKVNISDFIPEGLEPGEGLDMVLELMKEGISAVEPSCAIAETKTSSGAARPGISAPEEEAYLLHYADFLKKNSDVPVLLVGGMRSKHVMENALKNGQTDFISISRPLIREPDLPVKIMNGKEKADCVSCNGCFQPKNKVVRCVYNEE